MWFSLLGGVILLGKGGYDYWLVSQLRSEGISTLGTLFDSRTVDTGRGRTSYRITLDYQPEGSEMALRKEFVVPQPLYHLAQQTQKMPVIYLPSDPTTSQVGAIPKFDPEPIAMGAGLLLLATAVRFYLWGKMRQVEKFVGDAA